MRAISWLRREWGTTIQEDYNPQTLLTHQKERRHHLNKYKKKWIKYVAFETLMNVVFVMVIKLSKCMFLQLQELLWSGLVFIQTKRFIYFFSLLYEGHIKMDLELLFFSSLLFKCLFWIDFIVLLFSQTQTFNLKIWKFNVKKIWIITTVEVDCLRGK